MASQGVSQASFNLGSGRYLELVEPLGQETPVGRFLNRRDEGLYLIALAVDDVSEAMKTFGGQGIRTIPSPKGTANRTSGLSPPPLASP